MTFLNICKPINYVNDELFKLFLHFIALGKRKPVKLEYETLDQKESESKKGELAYIL